MIDLLRKYIIDNKLIEKNDKVLLALSGGMDSMVLFDLLKKLTFELEFVLFAAHFDHNLRKESKDDALFVNDFCAQNKIPISIDEADVKAYAKKEKQSIETAARTLRHAYLKHVAHKLGANKIALAHHKNDRAETYLMRVIRGSSLDGLGCMPEKDGILIRPLLCATHDEIKNYAKQNKLTWREDKSNKDVSFTRNNIRHNTFVDIKENYNQNIINTLANSASLMRQDREYFDEVVSEKLKKAQETDDGYYLCDDDFIYLHKSLLSRCIRKTLANLGFKKDIYETNINQIMELFSQQKTGAMINLPNGAIARRDAYGVELIRKEALPEIFNETPFNIKVATIIPNCGTFTCENTPVNIKKLKSHSKNIAFFDTMSINNDLSVRTRRKGDVFHPLGAPGKKSLKEFFINKKISRFKRDYIPLITCGNEILWIVGHEISDKVKVTQDTALSTKIIFEKERGSEFN